MNVTLCAQLFPAQAPDLRAKYSYIEISVAPRGRAHHNHLKVGLST